MPFQLPGPAVSVDARWAVPEIVGAETLTGGAAGTTAVAALAADTVASGLVAVTSMRTRLPSSETPSV